MKATQIIKKSIIALDKKNNEVDKVKPSADKKEEKTDKI